MSSYIIDVQILYFINYIFSLYFLYSSRHPVSDFLSLENTDSTSNFHRQNVLNCQMFLFVTIVCRSVAVAMVVTVFNGN